MANTRIKRFFASILIVSMLFTIHPNYAYAMDAGMYDEILLEDTMPSETDGSSELETDDVNTTEDTAINGEVKPQDDDIIPVQDNDMEPEVDIEEPELLGEGDGDSDEPENPEPPITVGMVTGVTWDQNSYTATWNEVENATSYLVEAYIYNGDSLVSTINKESISTSVDLEGDIVSAAEGQSCVYVNAFFNVTAKAVVEEETIIGDVSTNSEIKPYYLIDSLDQTTNIRWLNGEAATAYWTVVKHATSYVVDLEVYLDGTKIGGKSVIATTNQIDISGDALDIASAYENKTIVVKYTVYAKYEDANGVTLTGDASEVSEEREIYVLTEVNNVLWKANATATGTWNAVSNANYYLVNVIVEGDGEHIGSTQTGTSDTEIDLQAEISHVIGDRPFEYIEVYFTVIPQILQTNGVIISGRESSISDALEYKTTMYEVLDIPNNVTLSVGEIVEVSWDRVEHAECYRGEIKIIDNESGMIITDSLPLSPSEEYPIRIDQNITEYLANRGLLFRLSGKSVKISVRIYACMFGNTANYYRPSEYSEWSNEENYVFPAGEYYVLNQPTIIDYDEETLELSATCDPIADYVDYYIEAVIGDETFSKSFCANRENEYAHISNGQIQIEYKQLLNSCLTQYGIENIKCNLRLGLQVSVASSEGYSFYTPSERIYTDFFEYSIGSFPKLEKATNLKWDKNGDKYTVTFDRDKRADQIKFVEVRIRNNGIIRGAVASYGYSPTDDGVIMTEFDINDAYRQSGQDPAPVFISVRLRIATSPTNPVQLIISDWSDWSEEILFNPADKKLVESIKLSPMDPVCAVGRTTYIGKTITPEDAYYTNIIWTSSDTDVATIDDAGKITGLSVGRTNIGAKIYTAEKEASLSVYAIESNVDPEEDKNILDDATAIIENIVVDGNVERTDIEDVQAARNEIEKGAKNGDQFNVSISTDEKSAFAYNELKDELCPNADVKIAGGFDVTIGVSHQDRHGKENHIANITELSNPIDFELALTDSMTNVPDGFVREYSIAKIHDGVVTELGALINPNGPIKLTSSEFSDFVVLYQDYPADFYVADIPNYVYSGKNITPSLEVYYNGTLLKNKTDYTVKFKNNKNVGIATAIVTGKGSFSGTTEKSFLIVKDDISAALNALTDQYVYYKANKSYKPTFAITYNGKKLSLGKDYELSWSNEKGEANKGCIAAGEYEVTISGINNYSGKVKRKLVVADNSQLTLLSSAKITKIPNQKYSDGILKEDGLRYSEPVIEIKLGKSIVLKEGEDYTIQYFDNYQIGKAKLRATGKGKYAGTIEANFNISGTAISGFAINGINSAGYTYSGYNIEPAITVSKKIKVNGTTQEKVLVEGTDYFVSYSNSLAAGKGKVTVTGKGEYTGSKSAQFKILKYDLSKADASAFSVNYDATVDYSKFGAKPAISVNCLGEELAPGKDYTVTYYNNKAVAGAEQVNKNGVKTGPAFIVAGKGNFTGKTAKYYFTINERDISEMLMLISDKEVSNRAQAISTPSLFELLESKQIKLKPGKDYNKAPVYKYVNQTEVKYKEKNVLKDATRSAGEEVKSTDIVPDGTLIIAEVSGINNYKGTTSQTYRIIKTKTDISKASVTIPNQMYTGSAITVPKDAIKVTMKDGKSIVYPDFEIVSYSNNISKGTASITLRGTGNYGGLKTAKFKIVNRSMLYRVTFDSNGAGGYMPDQCIKKAIEQLTKCSFEYDGKQFKCWNTRQDGSGRSYTDMEEISSSGKSGMVLNLYAQWE